MQISEFDYELPEELIAQDPISDRSSSRLLVLDPKTGEIRHRIFRDILEELKTGDCLVLNNTRVIPARLYGTRLGTGGAVEILLLVLGFPLWFPLLLTILILGLTAYLLVWTLVLVLAAVVLALGLSAVAGVIAAVYFIIKAGLPLFLLSLGAALVLTGLAVLFGFATAGMGRLAVKLGKAMVRGLKSLLIRKEDKA